MGEGEVAGRMWEWEKIKGEQETGGVGRVEVRL